MEAEEKSVPKLIGSIGCWQNSVPCVWGTESLAPGQLSARAALSPRGQASHSQLFESAGIPCRVVPSIFNASMKIPLMSILLNLQISLTSLFLTSRPKSKELMQLGQTHSGILNLTNLEPELYL